ncbi:MAG: glycosyltransferase, partial [Pirellula sp.]
QKWMDYSHSTRGFKRWLYLHEANRVRHLERRLSVEADAVSVVSSDEAALYRKHHLGLDAHAISNGVDHDYFAPDAVHEDHWSAHRHGVPQMVFVGVLDYLPNVQGLQWFCETVMPLILQEFPGALLEIVGRRPSPAVRELARHKGVRLVGEVSDVRPHVLAADIAIAPLQIARGIQNKVLEALACGRPVIATPEAATGIESRGGLFVVESPDEWLAAIRTLQCQHQTAQARGQAREGIIDQYSWDARLSPILEMLDLNNAKRSDHRGWRVMVE